MDVVVNDSCPTLITMNSAEQAHFDAVIAKLSEIIISDDDMNFLLPPARCTRSQKKFRAAALKASSSKFDPKEKLFKTKREGREGREGRGKMTGGVLTDDQKKKAKRYLAWVLAISATGGLVGGVYNSGIVTNVLTWLVSNTWLGGQLNGVAAIFENLLQGCDSIAGVAGRWGTKQATGATMGAVGAIIPIPGAATEMVSSATMSCGQTITIIEKILENTKTSVELLKTQIGTAAGTVGIVGYLTGQTAGLKDYINTYIDFYEAILDKLFESFDWTAGASVSVAGASVSVTVAAFKYLTSKSPAQIEAAAEAVRTTPGAYARRSASAGYLSVPGPGGKKTNKRRKQSKRKPKRKSKRTSKRRSKK